jgi:hypothetical protein
MLTTGLHVVVNDDSARDLEIGFIAPLQQDICDLASFSKRHRVLEDEHGPIVFMHCGLVNGFDDLVLWVDYHLGFSLLILFAVIRPVLCQLFRTDLSRLARHSGRTVEVLRINCPYRYRCVGGDLKVGESAIVKPMKEEEGLGEFPPDKRHLWADLGSEYQPQNALWR